MNSLIPERRHSHTKAIVVGIVAIVALGVLAYSQRVIIRGWFLGSTDLPPAEEHVSTNTTVAENVNTSANTNVNTNTATTNTTTSSALPSQKNLKVPFTSQAPLANWDHAHEEACEEASALMVDAFWHNRSLSDKTAIDAELVTVENWEVEKFGYYEDTTAAETTTILKEYYKLPKTTVKAITSWDDVKREIAAGRPVIVPTAGRDLHNPNFTGAGPAYHNIVIKGYLKDGRLITNDPGTRKGADYIYSADVLWNAIHDWTGHAADGAKVMIVVTG